MRARSQRRTRIMATERAPLVAQLIIEGVRCEIGHVLAAHGVWPFRCANEVQGIHERRKRSGVGSLIIPENLIPACNWCNGWVEDTGDAYAREIYGDDLVDWLVVRPGDPDWDLLGRTPDEHAGRLDDHARLTVAHCMTCHLPFCRVGPEPKLGMVAPCGHSQPLIALGTTPTPV